jgi:hypothetical protein
MALRDCHGYNGIISVERAEAFMSTESSSKTEITSSNSPEWARRLAWIGPPPLFKGEDAAAYDELSARIAGAMNAVDIFDEIWAGDIVDCDWTVFRLRRLQANLMTATAYEGLQKIPDPLVEPYRDVVHLARAWAARDKSAIKRVDELLASAGLTMDAVMAQTLCTYLDEFERIERMIASAEARRGAILYEVELHRGRRRLWRAARQTRLELERHRG